ncbi:MAG: hypothetical protein ACPG80_01350 [Rickettsiales bacterium]
MSEGNVEAILARRFFPGGRAGMPLETLEEVVAQGIVAAETAWRKPVGQELAQLQDTIATMPIDPMPRDLAVADMGSFMQMGIMNVLDEARERNGKSAVMQSDSQPHSWIKAAARPAAEKGAGQAAAVRG